MGMTLWIQTLEGRSMSKDSDDYSMMHRFSDDLDAICAEKSLPMFSGFFDYSDLNLNMGDEFDEEGDEAADVDDADEGDEGDDEAEPEMDAETGLAYGIDDMKWFDATDGLRTLIALQDALSAGSIAKLKAAQRTGLVEEIGSCISLLEESSKKGGKFHLAVIM